MPLQRGLQYRAAVRQAFFTVENLEKKAPQRSEVSHLSFVWITLAWCWTPSSSPHYHIEERQKLTRSNQSDSQDAFWCRKDDDRPRIYVVCPFTLCNWIHGLRCNYKTHERMHDEHNRSSEAVTGACSWEWGNRISRSHVWARIYWSNLPAHWLSQFNIVIMNPVYGLELKSFVGRTVRLHPTTHKSAIVCSAIMLSDYINSSRNTDRAYFLSDTLLRPLDVSYSWDMNFSVDVDFIDNRGRIVKLPVPTMIIVLPFRHHNYWVLFKFLRQKRSSIFIRFHASN